MAKRESKPDPVPHEKDGSVILMLALMMQMLAFFIVLTAMATITKQKRLAALNSISGTFGILAGGANLGSRGGPAMPARNIIKGKTAPMRTAKLLTETAKELGLGHAVHVLPLANGSVRIRMEEHILFAPGQVTLSPQARALIKRLAKVFSRPEILRVRIDGFTDETPARGSIYPSNWELSAARAMSALRALLADGVPEKRLIAAGMGGTHPIREHGRDLSRRVDIIIKFHAVSNGRKKFRVTTGKDSSGRVHHATETDLGL